MSSEIIRQYEKAMLRTDIPDFKPGDRLRVSLKIVEGDKERLQDFEGDLIRRKGSGITETITLRKVNYGVGVERIIPLHSPKVEKIKVVRQGRVRRAKLYYIRELSGKAARIKERKVLYGEAAKKAKAAEAARVAEQEEKRQQALAEQEQTKAQAEAQEQKAAEAASAQEQKAAEATSAEATTAEAPAAEAPEAKAEAAPEAATEETENKE